MRAESLKKSLGYVCKTNRGYVSDLVTNVGVNCMEDFESAGFITKGMTLKNDTWRKTDMADKYYKDVFGLMAYLRNVVL